MNEEVKFLKEHIKDICAYKGLQEELTYDVPLEILKRICRAFDFLQQENQQLKEDYNKVVHEATEFESKIYRLEEQLQQLNKSDTSKEQSSINYYNELKFYKHIIDELKTWLKHYIKLMNTNPDIIETGQIDILHEVLDKVKELESVI